MGTRRSTGGPERFAVLDRFLLGLITRFTQQAGLAPRTAA
jgi:hypothetical protein